MPRMSEIVADRRSVLIAGAAAATGLLHRSTVEASAPPALQRLVATNGRRRLLAADGPQTPIWGYNGLVPGPQIRVRQGGEVAATLVNELTEATTIHWHGVRIDNRMDGVAHLTQDAVQPGASFDYRFRVPDAGTFWYHPHAHRAMQQDRGMYGLLIVEEAEPVAVDRDMPLVIDDWRLEDGGAIETRSLEALFDAAHAGRLGNVVTVNSEPEPVIDVLRNERIRLRLVNTCNARVLELSLEGLEAQLVAIDGQPVAPEPLADGALTLPPSGRADVVVDVVAASATLSEASRERTVLATFAAVGDAPVRAKPLDTPLRLPRNPVPIPDLRKDPLVFELKMEGGAMGRMAGAEYEGRHVPMRELAQKHRMVWAMNGKADDHSKPVFSVARGRPVAIRMINDTQWPHAMHLHGHHFLVAQRSVEAVRPYFYDTVLMAPRETMTIAFVADNPGKWMLHCHMLEHQMSGMSCYFEVAG